MKSRSRSLLTACALALFTFFACKKDNITSNTPGIEDADVPPGFNWENSREVSLSIAVSDARFQDAIHLITVYDGDPVNGGAVISGGGASLVSAFNTKFSLASVIHQVYIVKTAPDGTTVTEKVVVNTANVSVSIGSESATQAVMVAGQKNKLMALPDNATTSADPACTSTVTSSGDFNLNNSDEVICVTGNNITVGFNFNASATVIVSGTGVRISSANLNNSSRLIVTASATVTAGSINLNSSSATFENRGTVTFDGGYSPGGMFTNTGTLTINGDFSLNSGASFTNSGTINISGSMNSGSNNAALNNGKIITSGSFRLNSGVFVNNCSLYARNEYHNNGTMRNYSYIRADNTSYLNSGELGLYNGAMFSTVDIFVNTTIRGTGSASLVKVSGGSTINGGGVITGAVQYCDQNGIETNNGTFSGGASQGCGLYIAINSCNAEGNGTAPVVDSDGDGVADAIDAYPNDPAKAFNNYYPSASANAASTLAFEDRWPVKGDYDMNDVVISYKYTVVTNAQNRVVQVMGTYHLIATGGTYQNGFGVEFPVTRANVENLSGGTLEAGQTNAVVVLFSNTRAEQAAWNTRPGEATAPVKTYTISFDVKSAPLLSTFGLGAYNPFIWNNSLGRGYETHLAGKTPTSLANNSLFGTGDDRTGSGKYYVTDTGLPWVVDVPQSSFSYPVEGVDISKAYLRFVNWANSGGASFTDWYSNTAPAYRSTGNLYPAQ